RTAQEGSRQRAPVASYTSWEPPEEADDEKPILADAEDTTSPLPRYTVEGEEQGVRPERTAAAERAPRASQAAQGDRSERGESAEPAGFVQLFVNVGKREGVNPGDLQKLLTDKGLGEAEAGPIRLHGRMASIRGKKEVSERPGAALTGQVVGGRTGVAERARGRG